MNLKHKFKSIHILAFSIGLIYLWFGTLKYFPELSPAEDLAKNTINALTFNIIPSNAAIILLAVWESLIGILLILNILTRTAIIIALAHMLLTFTPLLLFPEQVFNNEPFQLTLLGQYIFKNLIIIGGLLTLYKSQTANIKLQTIS